ncbi:hypothetical protein CLV24_12856 [Pontibacter ummariensis]|uniref:Uncharacterized protein n=1 Tax=Pontibacter ummariensis TaxID=1610492 RepID=A0A239K9A0_9BACT|nr:hypothetical protein [Pontibacter ummariensis]PRY06074.1 hypothetical protein CLV24_12856 [Pontibacter ummariensis]SNT14957.1 hypothetical protein SAMN06296052_12756 [Pontibacter ummariensis]
MNTKLKGLGRFVEQLNFNLNSLLIAMAAVGCAVLVETRDIDYTYPLELVLKGIVNDTVILTISTK